MKIAICDDCKEDRENIRNTILLYRPDWNITCYESGEDLLEAYNDGVLYDLIFLDIYMKELDGLSTSKLLRKDGCQIALIFLSNSKDFAIESYDVNALYYLVKPVKDEKILKVIDYFESNYKPKQIKLGNHLFLVNDILYIESQNKSVIVNCKNGIKTKWTAKLNDIELSINGDNFLRCHRSYIINMDNIYSVSKNSFVLSNDISIPIKRQDIGEITNCYYKYITL